MTWFQAKVAIGKTDRITIEGLPGRMQQETEAGFVIQTDDERQLALQYTHEELMRLDNAHRIRIERGYFDPHFAVKRQLQVSTACSGLATGIKTRTNKKEAYCQASNDMRRDGLMKLTDESIKANMFTLMGRAIELTDNLNPTGKDKLPKSEDFSISPSARTLRRWATLVLTVSSIVSIVAVTDPLGWGRKPLV